MFSNRLAAPHKPAPPRYKWFPASVMIMPPCWWLFTEELLAMQTINTQLSCSRHQFILTDRLLLLLHH